MAKRYIKVEDAKLRLAVEKKFALVEEGRALQVEAEKVQKQHETLIEKMQSIAVRIDTLKLKEILPQVRKLVEKDLGQYEIAVTTEIKDGDLVVETLDMLEEYKERFTHFDKWKEPIPKKK